MGVTIADDWADDAEQLPSPSNPMAVARVILDDYLYDGAPLLLSWRGGWMYWRRSHWEDIADAELRSVLYKRLERAEYWGSDGSGKSELKPWAPNRRKVADLADAIAGITHLPESVDPPTWLDRITPDVPQSRELPAGQIVACDNGLLYVGTRELVPHTPHYFNRVAVPFEYDPDAAEPKRWLEFLNELWPDDPDSIAALQEYFGYVLSGRTDLHKILLLIGPTRSGKGTIARVLAALLGRGNAAGPTLASLGTNFGLSPLLGKPLAVVSDARLGGGNVHQVVERLLSISGEDMLTIDRKYREPWTGKLQTRFVILSNELPRFGDASGAIAYRFIVLTMNHSFLGRENTRLTDELLTELPGILGWSLDGLDRLSRSSFTIPASSDDATTTLQDLVSPVAAFVRDCCEVGPYDVRVAHLFAAWKDWCEDNSNDAGSAQTFGRDLRAVVPNLRTIRPRDGDSRERRFAGLRLTGVNNAPDRGPSRTSGPDERLVRDGPRPNPMSAQHEQPSPECAVCGNPLLLNIPGRDTCERCRLDSEKRSTT